MNVTTVGRGKVGSNLRAALKGAGIRVDTLQGRAERLRIKPGTELVILAVPDAVIPAVADRVEASPGVSVVHVAGSRGLDDLLGLQARGLSVGVMHPLVSFASKKGTRVQDATFVCGGDKTALRRMRSLCNAIGARYLLSNAHGPAYHAAAALVAGGAASLADAGARILRALGFGERPTRRALAGLLRSVADNVESVGVPAALTGPVVRGDATTVRAHQQALLRLGDRHAKIYASVGPLLLACAAAAGLPARDQARVRAAFNPTSTKPARSRR